MKLCCLGILYCLFAFAATGQTADKAKRVSPPVVVKQTLASGAVVTIDYSQPSVKGRVIGKDLEPKEGEVWRAGANEATILEVSKDVKINGSSLPAGKYSLFTISGKDEWTVILNKTWSQWGAYEYKVADDVLRLKVKPGKAPSFAEKMTFDIDKSGVVSLLWGDYQVSFNIQ